MTSTHTNLDWVTDLPDSIPNFLKSVQVNKEMGRYTFASSGLTPQGKSVALGMSCYAMKLYYILGLWDNLSETDQLSWIRYIQSFQTGRGNAFVDPAVYGYLHQKDQKLVRGRGRKYRITHFVKSLVSNTDSTHLQRVIHAETKQAIATLIEVDAMPNKQFAEFPKTSNDLQHHLNNLNWANPWEAGAHTATIAVFLRVLEQSAQSSAQVAPLKTQLSDFIAKTVDGETGAYYLASDRPDYNKLVNGAMKVLTGLDWLDVPIHRPEALIDTTLSQLPSSEGCHLVDAIYVLYRASQQVDYRRQDIQDYALQVLAMTKEHYVEADGAFSYFRGKSQTNYYGVPMTTGEAVADMHGTILLTWALSMIFALLDDASLPQWHIIKP